MVIVPARQATQAGGIHSLEPIPTLHKRLKIRALGKVQYKYQYQHSGENIKTLCLYMKYTVQYVHNGPFSEFVFLR